MPRRAGGALVARERRRRPRARGRAGAARSPRAARPRAKGGCSTRAARARSSRGCATTARARCAPRRDRRRPVARAISRTPGTRSRTARRSAAARACARSRGTPARGAGGRSRRRRRRRGAGDGCGDEASRPSVVVACSGARRRARGAAPRAAVRDPGRGAATTCSSTRRPSSAARRSAMVPTPDVAGRARSWRSVHGVAACGPTAEDVDERDTPPSATTPAARDALRAAAARAVPALATVGVAGALYARGPRSLVWGRAKLRPPSSFSFSSRYDAGLRPGSDASPDYQIARAPRPRAVGHGRRHPVGLTAALGIARGPRACATEALDEAARVGDERARRARHTTTPLPPVDAIVRSFREPRRRQRRVRRRRSAGSRRAPRCAPARHAARVVGRAAVAESRARFGTARRSAPPSPPVARRPPAATRRQQIATSSVEGARTAWSAVRDAFAGEPAAAMPTSRADAHGHEP